MILRHCVCIPTYNNPKTIAQVVRDCLQQTDFPILIVDDGSNTPVADLLDNESKNSPRLTIHRFSENQGKGVALQFGIQSCVSRGFTHMIAIDGDGQHLPSEISKLTALSLKNPWDLIIGNRKMTSSTVPQISKFGRKFSNFWVHFQTDTKIADSQSGFRIYPLFHVQNMRFWTSKFDFEIEVLIRLMWKRVAIVEAEVEVIYQEGEERVSHFNKLHDNIRISLLNAVLVILSLLKSHKSPLQTGIAVGVGALVGCTPFFGLHTPIVAAISFFFRLNAVYLWLGSQVSLPFFAPFIIAASVHIGEFLTGRAIHTAEGFSWGDGAIDWLIGSVVLGVWLGLVLGVLSAILSWYLQRSKKTWTGSSRGGHVGNTFMKYSMKILGLRFAYAFLYFAIPYFYIFAPKARNAGNAYWKISRPEIGFWKRQYLVLKQLNTFAQILTDRVYQRFHTEKKFGIISNGMQNITDPLQSGQGLMMVGAHIGGWDIATALLPHNGMHSDFFMLQFQSEGLTVEKAMKQKDEAHINRLHHNRQDQSILTLKKLLESAKPVGIMGDRPMSNHYELVPFMGKLAAMDATPYRVASACSARLLFTFGFKDTGKNYNFMATPSKVYKREPGHDPNIQVYEWVLEFAQTLEVQIKRFPEQWFNFFDFWSVEPQNARSTQAIAQRHYLLEQLRKQQSLKPGLAIVPKPIV